MWKGLVLTMQQRRVRLEDIAESTGYSVSTVSRALRGDPRVSTTTRRIVELEANRLNYPFIRTGSNSTLNGSENAFSSNAGPLKDLKKVAVIMRRERQQYFFTETLLVIIECGRKHGFEVDFELTSDPVETFLKRKDADAVFFITWEDLTEEDGYAIQSHPVPVILINRHVEGLTNSVTLDNFAFGLHAVRYLMRKGHRRIAYIPGQQSSASFRERSVGFRYALERAGCFEAQYFGGPIGVLPLGDARRETIRREAIREEAIRLANLSQPPTAVAGFNDFAASVVLVTMRDLGLKVPEDVSVLGFDYSFDLSPYEITTFDYRRERLGTMALYLLEGLMSGEIEGPFHMSISPKLVERETVGIAKF